MNGKRWMALGIAALIFVASVLINLASSALSTDFSKMFDGIFTEFEEEVVEEGLPNKKIAVLELNGVIQDKEDASSIFTSEGYNHRLFMKQLNEAKDNAEVKALILRVNTPGGGVVESAEIHDKIVQIQEEAKKPVYVSMAGMAASGGYYISAPADKIFAHPDTMTGSLGVIMQGLNYSELAEKLGIDFMTIKSGKHKDIMSPTREMTKEEKEIMHSMLNNAYNGFVKVIADGRNMSKEKVKEIADGRIYDGRQAKELNLVDDFGYLEDVITHVREDHQLKDASVVKYGSNLGFGSLFGATAMKIAGKEGSMSYLMNELSQPNAPRLMYLYSK